jgi:AraC family transcriptional regulator, regulatory protein of adaptative response / methylated-DNA-[protein]-cysteine methyltransferase
MLNLYKTNNNYEQISMSPVRNKKWYEIFVNKQKEYNGTFFVGIKTTGIFCHVMCPARRPKFENCIFFKTTQAALDAFYRPCKRCMPLAAPDKISDITQQLLQAIEKNPGKKWCARDLKNFSTHESTIRRQFKKKFGITFIAYTRARRLGHALIQIKKGKTIVNSQISSGYESGSGFREAFEKIMGSVPTQAREKKILNAQWLDTPLGTMLAVADEEALYLLEFLERKKLEAKIKQLQKKLKAVIIPGITEPLRSIKSEIIKYYTHDLDYFKTPVYMMGSDFQKKVWSELQKIPYGKTISYAQLAKAIGNPQAYRAVARANATNQMAIIIPCHRVINTGGKLGGYASGLARKQWLLDHEKKPKIKE